MMGGATGALGGGSFGALAGFVQSFNGGLRGGELLRAAGKQGLQVGAMFGLFLSIGSFVRSCTKIF
jgi:hypothetical protein